MLYPPTLNRLIEALRCLPGVGPKSAQRMAFHLLERDRDGAREHFKKALATRVCSYVEYNTAQAELTRQEMLAQQNKEKVEADTVRIRAVILARQDQAVRLTAGNRELEVAKLERDAAAAQAEAILLQSEAEKEVIRMKNEAEAEVITGKVLAFETGMNLARYRLYERIGPRIASILSTDQESGLGGLFLPYLPPKKEVAP